jgi:ribosomal protein L29
VKALRELRSKSDQELIEELQELRTELRNIGTKIRSGGAVENSGQVKNIRRRIARILTILNERKRGMGPKVGEEGKS